MMIKLYNIKDSIISKHLVEAFIEQLTVDYKAKGYEVIREYQFENNFKADLMVKSSDEIIVFEFKTGKLAKNKKEQILHLKNYITKIPNAKFKLILVNPPTENEIYVEEIENIIENYFFDYGIPDVLDELSTHTRIEEITDIELNTININKENIEITGSGFISVSLQYGSDGDFSREDGDESEDSFPFTFEIELNHLLQIINFEYHIDTTDFYE